MPTRSTKKKNEAHVAMVMPNWAITGADNDHHCRSMAWLRSAPHVRRGVDLAAGPKPREQGAQHSAVKEA